MKRAITTVFSRAFVALFLVGCSTVRVVDSDVTTFSDWTAQPPSSGSFYRFERLPSQQAVAAQQDKLEGLANSALAKVGMQLNSQTARYSIQVSMNTQLVSRLTSDGLGYDGFGYGYFGVIAPGVFIGGGNRGSTLGLSFPMRFATPWFKRELTIFMRELTTNKIVFESRVLHDGVWSDTLAVLPAMLDAALQGFPQPPAGTRRINVEIPR